MSNSDDLRHRYGPWALVTGASSGIGAEFARQLARAGLHVVLVARREEHLRTLQTELMREHNVEVEVVAQDLSALDAADRVVAALEQRDVGLVVSNAGFGLKGNFTQHASSTIDAMLNVNMRTPLLLLHALLPKLRQRSSAGIILTGSIEGEVAFPWSSAYAATKAFVHGFGLSLHGELAGTGVNLLVLAPGSTDTEAGALQGITRENMLGLMTPAEVARQALAELGKKPLHIPGWHNRAFIGFLRMLPRRWSITLAGKGMANALARSGNPVKN